MLLAFNNEIILEAGCIWFVVARLSHHVGQQVPGACLGNRSHRPRNRFLSRLNLRLHGTFVLNYHLLYRCSCSVLLNRSRGWIAGRLDEHLINFGDRGQDVSVFIQRLPGDKNAEIATSRRSQIEYLCEQLFAAGIIPFRWWFFIAVLAGVVKVGVRLRAARRRTSVGGEGGGGKHGVR